MVVDERYREYDGFFKLDRVQFSHRRFDGRMSMPVTRLVFERGDSAAALTFRLRLRDISTREAVRVTFNGTGLPELAVARDQPSWRYEKYYPGGEEGGWLECPLPAAALKRGDNEVSVACAEPVPADPPVVEDLQLEVRPA